MRSYETGSGSGSRTRRRCWGSWRGNRNITEDAPRYSKGRKSFSRSGGEFQHSFKDVMVVAGCCGGKCLHPLFGSGDIWLQAGVVTSPWIPKFFCTDIWIIFDVYQRKMFIHLRIIWIKSNGIYQSVCVCVCPCICYYRATKTLILLVPGCIFTMKVPPKKETQGCVCVCVFVSSFNMLHSRWWNAIDLPLKWNKYCLRGCPRWTMWLESLLLEVTEKKKGRKKRKGDWKRGSSRSPRLSAGGRPPGRWEVRGSGARARR